jgi:hypothetical protein
MRSAGHLITFSVWRGHFLTLHPGNLLGKRTSQARATSSNARFTDGFFARAALCLASEAFYRYASARGDIRGRGFLWYAKTERGDRSPIWMFGAEPDAAPQHLRHGPPGTQRRS